MIIKSKKTKAFNSKFIFKGIISILIMLGVLLVPISPILAKASASELAKLAFLSLISTLLQAIYGALMIGADFFSSIFNWLIDGVPTPGFVEVGWNASVQVVNAFFIIILLTIAIGTIIGLKSYNFKALLPRFVVGVLLVNFSFFFATSIVTSTNNLTAAFTAGSQEQGLVTTMLNKMQLQRWNAIELPKENEPQSWYDTIFKNEAFAELYSDIYAQSDAPVLLVIRLFFMIIAAIVLNLVFIAFDILLVGRLVFLWILISIAPFPFLFYILPSTRTYAKQWWDKFIKQAFIAPILGLFIFFMRAMLDSIDTIITDRAPNLGVVRIQLAAVGEFNPITGLVVGLIFLGYGLAAVYAANQLGAIGAKGVQSAAGKLGGAIKARSTRAIKSGFTRGPRDAAAQIERNEAAVKQGTALATGKLSKGKYTGAIARGLGGSIAKSGIRNISNIKDPKNLKELSPEDQVRWAKVAKKRDNALNTRKALVKGSGTLSGEEAINTITKGRDAQRNIELDAKAKDYADMNMTDLHGKYQSDKAGATAAAIKGGNLGKLLKQDGYPPNLANNATVQNDFINDAFAKEEKGIIDARKDQHAKAGKAKGDYSFAVKLEMDRKSITEPDALKNIADDDLGEKDPGTLAKTLSSQFIANFPDITTTIMKNGKSFAEQFNEKQIATMSAALKAEIFDSLAGSPIQRNYRP